MIANVEQSRSLNDDSDIARGETTDRTVSGRPGWRERGLEELAYLPRSHRIKADEHGEAAADCWVVRPRRHNDRKPASC